ncbi:MAG: recombination mediator protein UvsY [Novosphingobium sp.]|jgi:hypothetical protein|nr:recombination mediator protein UvsY [Novosphingobium sp.]
MENNEFDFEQDLAIDPSRLDEEWLAHPVVYMKYCNALTDITQERDKQKEKLEVVKAELDRDIRSDPGKFSLAKITEGAISSALILQPKYKNAQEELNNLTYQVNMIGNAVKAFEHRKKALEAMVDLYINQYWAGPKEPRNLPAGKRMVDIALSKTTGRQRDGLNKSKGEEEKMEAHKDNSAPEEPTQTRRQRRSRD